MLQIAVGSFFFFLRRDIKKGSRSKKSLKASKQHNELSSLDTTTGPCCLGVSFLIVIKTETTCTPLLMQTWDLNLICQRAKNFYGTQIFGRLFSARNTDAGCFYEWRKAYPSALLKNQLQLFRSCQLLSVMKT